LARSLASALITLASPPTTAPPLLVRGHRQALRHLLPRPEGWAPILADVRHTAGRDIGGTSLTVITMKAKNAPSSARTAARLVEHANTRGGPDNITVVLVRVGYPPALRAALPDTARRHGDPARRGVGGEGALFSGVSRRRSPTEHLISMKSSSPS
jgi:hypothetical protein